MNERHLNVVFLGLTITSSWGNGHATTYRGLVKELAKRGHTVTFLERDVPWYASNREFDTLPHCRIGLYKSLEELKEQHVELVRTADVVVVGSYVPDGIAVGQWVTSTTRKLTAFYDIDTPVTLAHLSAGTCEYLTTELCPKYNIYFSFTGGPTLTYVENELRSPFARPLYCSVDPSMYFPEPETQAWDLAYLGTYAADRQPALQELLVRVAEVSPDSRFVVAGPQYPEDISWPRNVERIEHLPASDHRPFYNSQRFTLNVTRQDMVRAGYSPSVRLFEAAACGVPILTDEWIGLETFFEPGSEILPVREACDVTSHLRMSNDRRLEIADRARRRTLKFHTAAVRVEEFEAYVRATFERLSGSSKQSRSARRQQSTAAVL